MKVTELMIGDWVLISLYDCIPYPNKVCGIEYHSWKGKDYCDCIDCEDWDELSPNEVQPIPITKGFLTKNDFFCLGTNQQYYLRRSIHYAAYGKVVIEPTTVSVDGNPVWNLEIASLSYGEGTVLIQYVHELQHNLRNFGFDKKEIIV